MPDDQAQLDIAHASSTTELVVGRHYQAIGPADGTKLGPPRRIRVDEDLGDRVRVTGRGLTSPFVLKRAACLWTPTAPPTTEGGAS